MKTRWWIVGVCLICLVGSVLAASRHQIGTSSSGSLSRDRLRMQVIVGQNATGKSENLTSGFLNAPVHSFVPGDVNASGDVDISDAVFLISYIFGSGQAPVPLVRGDVDCTKSVDISDAVFLISYIFAGGSAPQYCW